MLGRENTTADYDGRRTLVIGDVNTGKTRLTEKVMTRWVAQGRSHEIAVLDLAPETQETIGGRIHLPAGFQGVLLATTISAPRLSGRDEEEADLLAQTNAAAIEPLFKNPRLANCSILVINDVTLYLQAGNYDCLWAAIQPVETVLINAYYGDSFPDYRLSRQERRLTELLIKDCHQVIRLAN
ncbi:MAG: hypothetical protein HF981_11930 [Desulfobacteraceae bacterium]|nr:hypothetical protein [Desulfobacteraceae bacterium]MBC2751086.1 hypothetical protein [Desulfobacteraceae bacterium]